MLLPKSVRLVRNLAVAFLNGLVTLIILLIAPLGLLAVITNTILVTLSTYFLLSFSDGLLLRMFGSAQTRTIQQKDGLITPWISEQLSKKRRDE
jgi:hypothetical protein